MDSIVRDTAEDVRDYYGQVLKGTGDLRTAACCPAESVPGWIRKYLMNIDDEILARFYGCGSPVPASIDGATVLDLGCGTGRDCYVLSQLVGANGRVIGLDMTSEQLEVARRHLHRQMSRFGYSRPNVEFRLSSIEDLLRAGITDCSVDIVISNCVINLAEDKERVFREIFRVLKPGGELYFSDVFAGRRVPESLRHDKVLVGECLGGAMYIEDFRRLLRGLGCLDCRVVSKRLIDLGDEEITHRAGMIDFYSMTFRTFKCAFEDICENYGHCAWYLGTIPENPHAFELDDHHRFIKGLPVPICGNTARILLESRYAPHFRVEGDFSVHYGPFDCAPPVLGISGIAGRNSGACC